MHINTDALLNDDVTTADDGDLVLNCRGHKLYICCKTNSLDLKEACKKLHKDFTKYSDQFGTLFQIEIEEADFLTLDLTKEQLDNGENSALVLRQYRTATAPSPFIGFKKPTCRFGVEILNVHESYTEHPKDPKAAEAMHHNLTNQLSALLKPDIPKILRRNATIPCGIQIIHRKTNGNSNFYVKHEKIELPFHIHQDDDLHKGIMVVLGYGNESAKYDDAEIKKKSTTYLKKEGIYCIHCTLPEYVAASLEAQRLRAISKQNELMAEKCTKLLNALNKAYELPKLSPTQYRESFHKKPASITNTWYDRTSARNVGGYPR